MLFVTFKAIYDCNMSKTRLVLSLRTIKASKWISIHHGRVWGNLVCIGCTAVL